MKSLCSAFLCPAFTLGLLWSFPTQSSASSPEQAQPAESYANFTSDGTWCWFADPRAVMRDGRTYAGWITSDGSVQVGETDNTGGTIRLFTLHAQYQHDDHDNPALFFLPDGRLMVFYSKHSGKEMNLRVTTRPGDISEWGAEQSLDVAPADRKKKGFTYPNPVTLSAENNAIYLFWRGDNWKPTYSKSTDGGVKWQPEREIVHREGATSGNRPYVKIASNNKESIHMIFTDGHPQNETFNSVYYACYRNGAFFKADGTRICGVDELPFKPEQADCIYDAKTTNGGRAWVWDLAVDGNDRPILVYTRVPGLTDHRYRYARWDGVQWLDTEICAGGNWFPQIPEGKVDPQRYYSGGLVLDHADPSIVYLSRPVNGVKEIERWNTEDGGKSWKSVPVTANSKFDNVRPFVVRGHAVGGPTVLWMNLDGHYAHYTDYHTLIKMDRSVTDAMTPVKQ